LCGEGVPCIEIEGGVGTLNKLFGGDIFPPYPLLNRNDDIFDLNDELSTNLLYSFDTKLLTPTLAPTLAIIANGALAPKVGKVRRVPTPIPAASPAA
jgi:hypothetical protein